MPSPIEKTLNRVGDVIQDIFTGKDEPTTTSTRTNTGQTCLEIHGMRQRALHLKQNMWRRDDIEYSRPLVLAEYAIQTEFKVSTTDELLEDQKAKADAKKIADERKAEQKKKKKDEKIAKKQSKVAGVPYDKQPGGENTKTEPVVATEQPEKQNLIPDFGNNMFKHEFGQTNT